MLSIIILYLQNTRYLLLKFFTIHNRKYYSRRKTLFMPESLFTPESLFLPENTIHAGKYYSCQNHYSRRKYYLCRNYYSRRKHYSYRKILFMSELLFTSKKYYSRRNLFPSIQFLIFQTNQNYPKISNILSNLTIYQNSSIYHCTYHNNPRSKIKIKKNSTYFKSSGSRISKQPNFFFLFLSFPPSLFSFFPLPFFSFFFFFSSGSLALQIQQMSLLLIFSFLYFLNEINGLD